MTASLHTSPIAFAEVCAFIAAHHRHHKPPVSHLFSVAASDGEKVVGVAVVGRPVARMLQDGWTAEVTRLATDGSKNACSLLYGAAWRAARALGYRRLVTYTLPEEGGHRYGPPGGSASARLAAGRGRAKAVRASTRTRRRRS